MTLNGAETKKNAIVIQGARQHNLKNINVTIPRDKFVVVTGVSGSGKSSLAFDIIYAEGQRRYVESLSAYARQFLEQMSKPDVDFIEGLSPAVSIEQKTTSRNPRSTVGTTTEIYDYLRLLYANLGVPHCTECGKVVQAQSAQLIVNTVMQNFIGKKCKILAPIIKGKKGTHQNVFDDLKKQGYNRVRVKSGTTAPKEHLLDESIELSRYKIHIIDCVVDRLVVNDENITRITESIEAGLKLGEGLIKITIMDDNSNEIDYQYSEHATCPDHPEFSLPKLKPRFFSFNSPYGACSVCTGLGFTMTFDPELIINPELTIRQGAVMNKPLKRGSWRYSYYTTLSKTRDFSLDIPYKELPENVKQELLYGSKSSFKMVYEGKNTRWENSNAKHEGTINVLRRRFEETKSDYSKEYYQSFMRQTDCPACRGLKLSREALAVTIPSDGINISEFSMKTCAQALKWITNLPSQLNVNENKIAKNIIREIEARLQFLISVGLPYITLDRTAMSLSGGENQRIRLATQIGSALVGVTYVLDEPSIGLHPRDQNKLLKSLRNLTDIGNTVLCVEHDHQTIMQADHILDLGIGAGVHGGEIVVEGPPEVVMKDKNSLTGAYLSGRKKIKTPKKRREGNSEYVQIIGAEEHNLKNIDVTFNLGKLICIVGVSGSGKSTLMNDTLYRGLMKYLHKSKTRVGVHKKFKGLENIDKVINIDQSPIGRTPRSNPGTYTKTFDDIRTLFAEIPEAKIRGYKVGRFSFNVKGGRCETCKGAGQIKIELSFLPDVWITCKDCSGLRYNKETLQVRYNGHNISEVLDLTVEEAHDLFENIPKIQTKLKTLMDVGLGYIKIGQPATTLSGGEAQRIKLSRELSKRSTGRTLYILDEPTTGLSTHDVSFLIKVLQKLVDANGNTVIVIEHNLEVIKCADEIIELGPQGGEAGGEIVAQGTPEQIAKSGSPTGLFLTEILNGKKSP